MTKRETSPETIPPETDDARSKESPAADRHRADLAKAAAKGLDRAMKDTAGTSESHTSEAREEQKHGKK